MCVVTRSHFYLEIRRLVSTELLVVIPRVRTFVCAMGDSDGQ